MNFKLKVKTKSVLVIPAILLLILLVTSLFYNLYFTRSIFPNISIGTIPVGGMSLSDATLLLAKSVAVPEAIKLSWQGQILDIPTNKINLKYNYQESAQSAYNYTRTGNILYDLQIRIALLNHTYNQGLTVEYDHGLLDQYLSVISGQVTSDAHAYSIKYLSDEVQIDRGTTGNEIDLTKLKAEIGYQLAHLIDSPVVISVRSVGQPLTDPEIETLKQRAGLLVGKTIAFSSEIYNFSLKDKDLIPLLDPRHEYNQVKIKEIVIEAAARIDRLPENSIFVFENNRAKEFSPSKEGLMVNQDSFTNKFIGNLRTLETTETAQTTLAIPLDITPPKIKTADVNNLGIKEVIGRGTSRFAGSIANRIYNIQLAASKFKGVLVAPGEIFSFVDTVGDISNLTGYKQAYIIKDGKTILGDGGGVCQVSTTLFRAALKAGLPIMERTAHAYRVYYYEQDSGPGMDATVYSPTTDLKFINNTPGYILIQPTVDTKNVTLTFDLYGTSDGRVATTTKPVVSSQIAPPEDVYQDDPTLKVGVVKQTEHKAWGAKVAFDYSVERNGEILFQKKFISNYRPWANVFLRGTGV